MKKEKKLIKALLTATLMMVCIAGVAKTATSDESWDLLIRAISFVESKNNEKVVNGSHVGILQISPGVVKDCNKVSKKKYTLSDRYSKEKSIEMFNIYQGIYNPERSIEKAIRIWNGGPGYTVRGTHKYYLNVMKKYRELKG